MSRAERLHVGRWAESDIGVDEATVDGLTTSQPSIDDRAVPLSRRYRSVVIGLVLSDGSCALLALVVAHLSLFGSNGLAGSWKQVVTAVVVWVGSLHAFGLYRVRLLSAFEEWRRLIGATCFATSLLIFIRASANFPPHRRWIGVTWLLALAFELATRRLWRWRLQRLRGNGNLVARTVILGTNDEGRRLAAAVDKPVLGFRVLGHIYAREAAEPGRCLLPVVGSLQNLDEAIRALGVDCVFVASTAVSAGDMVRVAQIARRLDVEIRMSANMADIAISRLSLQSFDGLLALSVRPVHLSGTQAFLKRSFDVCLGSLALLVSLPVMAAVAVGVRLSSPGPILFRQPRVTKDGRVFVMLKFRTMFHNQEKADSDGRVTDLSRPFFKLSADPRITSVGRILRKLSLDELPQLWQVVRGDLSLVGPRPLPLDQVLSNEELLNPRHEVRAGITGWWQINGRSRVDAAQALRMDLFYIENWSLSLDFFILLRTVGTVLSHRGAC
jgi:exopolysaccharide biosynthesis polyprenyl glycosylphosphotransferase